MYPCPPQHRWRALLQDDLSPAEQVELNGHLETCPACQRTLEECAANRDSWAVAHRYLGQPGPTREQALYDLMHRLKGHPDDQPEDAAAPLDFLDPSDHPGCLGRLGPYDVLGEVGRGGMGIVLKALDPGLHRVVAIKVLAPQLAVGATARKRFTREGRAAAAVCHDNVITIHAVEEFKGLPYLVMQYVAGPSLAQRIDDGGPLSVAEVLRIGTQTAAGLAAAHAQGLVHRDVKPANILLENGVERVKLTDFSLARTIDDVSVTQSGVVTGTPQYMAPEQARGEPLDARADLFSLGSVLYTLCAGRPPFRGHALEVLRKVSEDEPKPVRELNPEIPAWLEAIIRKLMAKRPADRFGTAAEVAALLERCLAHVQRPTAVPLPPIPGAPRPPRRPWRWAGAGRRWVAVGLFAFGVLLAPVVLKFRTAEGTLLVEIDDPNVEVKLDGTDVVITGAGVKEVRLAPGSYRMLKTKDGQPGKDEVVSIARGERTLVKVSFEPAAGVATGMPVLSDVQFLQRLFQNPMAREQAQAEAALEAERRARAALQTHVPTGQLIQDPRSTITTDFRAAITALAFTPDGKRLIAAGADGAVFLYDAASGKIVSAIRDHRGAVEALAVAPDGKVLATGGQDHTVKLWDIPTGRQVRALTGHAGQVRSMAFSPDGKLLASGADESGRRGEVKLWDVAAGQVRAVELAGPVLTLAFPPGRDDRLAVGLTTVGVHMIDLATGKVIYALQQPGPVHHIAFSPNGRVLAAAYADDGQLMLWDWQMDRQVATLRGHAAQITSLAFSPDGKLLATASLDGTAKLWDATANPPRVLVSFAPEKPAGGVWVVIFSTDGKVIVTAGADRVLRAWDVSQARPAPAVTPPPANPPGVKRYRIEFRDKPWREVLQWLSEQTGLPVVTGVRPTGTFTFLAPKGSAGARDGYTVPEVIDLLNEALMQQKLLLLRRDASFTIVPADERLDPALVPRVTLDALKSRGKTEVVSVVVPLKSLAANDLAPEIKKLLGPFGEVIALPRSKQLILQDTAGNLRRIVETIGTIEETKKGLIAPDQPPGR
jgi:WD40 repeat protein